MVFARQEIAILISEWYHPLISKVDEPLAPIQVLLGEPLAQNLQRSACELSLEWRFEPPQAPWASNRLRGQW